MMAQPLAKERIAADWHLLVTFAILCTEMIVKSTDSTLALTFSRDIKEGQEKSGVLQASLEPLLSSDDEKQAYKLVATARTRFIQARNKAVELKQNGQLDESIQFYNAEFKLAEMDLDNRVLYFVKLQREHIDATGRQIASLYQRKLADDDTARRYFVGPGSNLCCNYFPFRHPAAANRH